MTPCTHCEGPATHTCEQCGAAECLTCHMAYEVPLPGVLPRLCWRCQNEADQEWLRDPSKPRRTWPRKAPQGQRSLWDDAA